MEPKPVELGLSDVQVHVVKFGIDIYPPVEIPNERTRLNMFYEQASSAWPELFDELLSSNTQFEIAKLFRPASRQAVPGPSARLQTFILTQRGPVFVFPLLLPLPVSSTGLEQSCIERFHEVRRMFFSILPGRKSLRVGLVRELILGSGPITCCHLLTDRMAFAGANLVGANQILVYKDDLCNIRVGVETVDLTVSSHLPVGTTVNQPAGHGVRVVLDVNNHELRPLEDDDIEMVLSRATGLWPDELLNYLNERRVS